MSELENHDAMDVEMDELEQALTEALRRVDAPEGFAEKVMERTVGAEPPAVAKVVAMPQRHGSLRMRAWVGGAIAAALALGMFGAEQLHQRRERAEKAAVANEQFEAAVRVTDRALAQTREQLQRAGLKLSE